MTESEFIAYTTLVLFGVYLAMHGVIWLVQVVIAWFIISGNPSEDADED